MFVGNTLDKRYGCLPLKVEGLERAKEVKDDLAVGSAELIEKQQTWINYLESCVQFLIMIDLQSYRLS